MTTYTLVLDSNGNGIGSHTYGDANPILPTNEIICTQAQAQNPTIYEALNGIVVKSLSGAQTVQIASLRQSYAAAISANISFTDSAGVTDAYQADSASVAVLNNCLSGFRATGTVPAGFYWRSATNQNNPFTYADLEGLASAMTTRGFTNFAHLQTQAASVMAATTVSAVQAITY